MMGKTLGDIILVNNGGGSLLTKWGYKLLGGHVNSGRISSYHDNPTKRKR